MSGGDLDLQASRAAFWTHARHNFVFWAALDCVLVEGGRTGESRPIYPPRPSALRHHRKGVSSPMQQLELFATPPSLLGKERLVDDGVNAQEALGLIRAEAVAGGGRITQRDRARWRRLLRAARYADWQQEIAP
jgi:hypothetical protein